MHRFLLLFSQALIMRALALPFCGIYCDPIVLELLSGVHGARVFNRLTALA